MAEDWAQYKVPSDTTDWNQYQVHSDSQPNNIKPKEEDKSTLSSLWDKTINNPTIKMLFTGSNDELDKLKRESGIVDTKGPGLMSIPGLNKIGENIKESGIRSGDYWKGFGGSIASDLINLAGSGFDPRASSIKGSPIENNIRAPRTSEIAQRAMGQRTQLPDLTDVEEHLNNRPDLVPIGDEASFNDLRHQEPIDLEGKTLDLASTKQNMGRPNLTVDDVNKIFNNPPPLKEGTTVNFGNKSKSNTNQGPRVTSLKPATPELIQQAQEKGPDVIHLKTADKTQLENAALYGYKFEGVNSDGSLRLRKNSISIESSRTPNQDWNTQEKTTRIFEGRDPFTGQYPENPTSQQLATQASYKRMEDFKFSDPRNRMDYGEPNGTPELTSGEITKRELELVRLKENHKTNVNRLMKEYETNGSNKPPIDVPSDGGDNGGNEPPNNGHEHVGDIADRRKSTIAQEIMNLPRGIMASWDLSAPFRQGLGLIHRPEWWKSWNTMFKSFPSEDVFRASQDAIRQKPLFKQYNNQPSLAEQWGLHLTDLTDLSKREEQIMSTWAEKIPGVRASNRAYTTFTNKLRADTLENMVESHKIINQETGEIDMKAGKELANFINVATGRGSIGSLEKYAAPLNSLFFSPRLIASRLTMLNPVYYMTANPNVRKEAIKSLLAIAGTGTLVSQLGKLAGGTIENDPTSSDFGKLKIGNTRIDPFGGFQQYIVAANRLLQGRTTSSVSGKSTDLNSGRFGSQTRLDVAERFGESKLNPLIGLATTILRGKNLAGQKADIPEEVAQRFIPLFVQDLKNVATENPNLIPYYHESGLGFENTDVSRGSLALPGAIGMGIQNYPSR